MKKENVELKLNSILPNYNCVYNDFNYESINYAAYHKQLLFAKSKQTDLYRSKTIQEVDSLLENQLISSIRSEVIELSTKLGFNKILDIDEFENIDITDIYMLYNSLIYVEKLDRKNNKDSFFITKNPYIIDEVISRQRVEKGRRSIKNATQFHLTYREMETGYFEVIRVDKDITGISLSKIKIDLNQSNIISIPAFALMTWIDCIHNLLIKNQVVIHYDDVDGIKKQVLTTLNESVIQKKFKYSKSQLFDLSYNLADQYKLNKLRVLDLNSNLPGEIKVIPLLKIKNIDII